jgi:class 3 adenylate cyclase
VIRTDGGRGTADCIRMEPVTQYALRDGMHVGYQVWGEGGAEQADTADSDGPVDVLEFSSGLMISIDETVDEPSWLRFTERVADFSRLVRFDTAGLGLSDPLPTGVQPSIEGWGRDALAVMDAAGVARAVVLASAGGTMPALWLAATHPDRVASLVIVNGTARVGQAEDYGFGVSDLELAQASSIEVPLTEGDIPQDIVVFAPSLAHRVGFRDWWGRAARRGASPATALAFNLVSFSADVRWCLPDVVCSTLVLARSESYANLSEHGRYLAEHISGARYVTFPGNDLLPWAGEFDSIVDEIEEFVTGARSAHAPTRLLATVLFIDIVDSTVRAAAVGDREWRRVLDEFDLNVDRLLARHQGVMVKNTGDGILARFTAPARAVACATSMVVTADDFGVAIRAGLHAGEVEQRGDDIGGLAVHIASRVSAMAGAGEVLVTGTVRDLVVGSGITFDDRGRHHLKGVPDEWQVLAVVRD